MLLDMHGSINSRWNKEVIEFFVDLVKAGIAADEEPIPADVYLTSLVTNKVIALRTIWRKTISRRDDEGNVENEEATVQRVMQDLKVEEKRKRARSRRVAVCGPQLSDWRRSRYCRNANVALITSRESSR